jgi:hypothetical protein
MKIVRCVAGRLTSGSLVLALLISTSAMALPGPQEAAPAPDRQHESAAGQSGAAPAPGPPEAETLPDSPGAGRSQIAQNAGAQSEPAQSEPARSAPQPQPEQTQPQQNGSQKPVGTAAAETATTTGFAASKPAGAALAPAKQKRTRTILISVGAVVGAAVALGTVMALSKGTPSKPPGAP